MLNVYLSPKKTSLFQPSGAQLLTWLASLKQSGLFEVDPCWLDPTCDEVLLGQKLIDQLEENRSIELFPGIAISHLYNQYAHEALVPAELTLETLRFSFAAYPTLLPIEDCESLGHCPECGDQILIESLEQAIAKLDLFPLDTVTVQCLSCHDDKKLKLINFEPPKTFSRFWICLEQSASTRLSPHVIKGWESALGCSLLQLNAQREELEITEEGTEMGDLYSFDDPFSSALSRDRYRSERWDRRRGVKRHRQNKGVKRR